MSTDTAASAPPTAAGDLAVLTKPGITLLNACAAASGYWLAPVPGPWARGAAAVLGTALVVAGANALNCWLERDVDALMARTRHRPLPAGRVAPGAALAFGAALAAVGLLALLVAVNLLTAVLGAAALAVYVLLYTPLKRRTSLAVFVGALAGAVPPLMGWTAATGSVAPGGLLIFAVLFLWQVPHFLAISLFRLADYAAAGIKVLPMEVGEAATRREIVRYAIGVVGVGLVLVPAGVAGWLFFVPAAGLGLVLLGVALRGVGRDPGPRWARAFFAVTNLYLAGLFAALLAVRWLG